MTCFPSAALKDPAGGADRCPEVTSDRPSTSLPRALRPRLAAAASILAAAALGCAAPTAGAAGLQEASRTQRAEEHAALRAQRAEAREQRRREHAERREARLREREARQAERATQRASRHQNSSVAGAPAGTQGCTVSLEPSSTQLTAGETVTLSGTSSCAGPSAAIEVEQRSGSASAAAGDTTTTATPDKAGAFKVDSQPLWSNTVFIARAGGRRRAHVAVKVAPAITLSQAPEPALAASSSAGRRARASFIGAVDPAAAASGALVALQVSYADSPDRWSAVAYARVGADGTYTLAHRFRLAGHASVRAVVHIHGDAPGISEPLAYTVEQQQNPALSIESSLDPVVYGQATKITGVATAGPGTALTLSARVAGAPASTAATAVAGEGGAYSFEVSPQADTTYEVSDPATRSEPLFQAVSFDLVATAPPAAAQTGEAVVVSGTAVPGAQGKLVYLEARYPSGVGFHPVASAPLDATSAFSLSHAFVRPGIEVLRVRVPGDGSRQTTVSPSYIVDVSR